MTFRPFVLSVGTGLAMLLSGCNSATTESGDPAANIAESGGDDAARPTREDLLEGFAEAMERAEATTGKGHPGLWTLSDEDTTIHLFGTVHLLRPDLEWRFDAFENALAEADTVVFEVDMKSEEAQRAITTDFTQRGMYQDGRTLRAALDDEDEAVIEEALKSIGVPMDAFNAFEPWMVAVSLTSMKLIGEGYDLEAGVESVIEAEAQAAGKSFRFMETVSDQADAFDLLPEDIQIDYLYETAIVLNDSSQMLDQLVGEWADGDIEGMAALVASPDAMGGGEDLYQSLLVKRNQNWIPVLESFLEEPGTYFVAVGAGHLAGPDSVIAMLEDKGYTVDGPL